MNKFKPNDIVVIVPLNQLDPSFARVICYDSLRCKYKVLFFNDVLDPDSSWFWTYVKEEDLSLIFRGDHYQYTGVLKGPLKLTLDDYKAIYTKYFYYAKLLLNGTLSKDEFYKLERSTINLEEILEDDFKDIPFKFELYTYRE